jgi:Tfp pilus assembly protein PilP
LGESNKYLEMMFKLEGLVTVGALEFTQSSRFVVADHVTLQTVDVGEVLLANTARLERSERQI